MPTSKKEKKCSAKMVAGTGPENTYGENRIATAGSAMVLLALNACGEIQKH